ncbi:MAG: nucleolar zinc-finger protein [Pycnora praestabilis]|nr:MAG: nucleolar zinc-finger protein [Pycnora praestabilis]
MDNSHSEFVTSEYGSKANGGDLFEDVGKKVEAMGLSEAMTEGTNATSLETEDEEGPKVIDEIESLCMNCHEDNTEIQQAGEIQQRGLKCVFTLDHNDDFERQIVKSDTCVFRLEDLDLTMPAGRGQLTNIEGILVVILKDLEEKQPERREKIPEMYEKINEFVQKLIKMMNGVRFPFKISIDDPAGNSSIEPSPKDKAGKYERTEYLRTAEQNEALSLGDAAEAAKIEEGGNETAHVVPQLQEDTGEGLEDAEIVEGEVYSFPASCPGCTKPCATHMKMVEIPHFKQVVIMSTVCDHCGYRSNEVKTGGEVPAKGRRITLKVEDVQDLARDILKSESCAFSCPELDLHVQPGTLGGRFTTVEGLLTQIGDDLHAQVFESTSKDATGGDSMATESKKRWFEFFTAMEDAVTGKCKFTVVLEDPLASSYVQNLCAPDPDPQITIEDYERTEEEEEDLGLKDIKTEGYEEDHAREVATAQSEAADSARAAEDKASNTEPHGKSEAQSKGKIETAMRPAAPDTSTE